MVRKLKVIIAFGGFGVSRLRSRSAVGRSSFTGVRRKFVRRAQASTFAKAAYAFSTRSVSRSGHSTAHHLNKVIDDGGTRSDTASTTGSGLCERGGHVPLRWSLLALLSSLGPILGFQEASMNAMWRDRLLGRP